jgi:hypothetical protein
VNDAYKALTTREGLSAWWATGTTGDSDKVGGVIKFRFGERGGFDMKVLELQPARRALWQVIDGPAEWVGTTIGFDLRQDGDWIPGLLQAPGLEGASGVHASLQHQMGVFLVGLKSLLETGKGAAYPDDLKLDSWE